ncbi:MAG TPA: hypothetical protein V6D03_12760, partial [Candidatus Caenarcaniphilales bacterium]
AGKPQFQVSMSDFSSPPGDYKLPESNPLVSKAALDLRCPPPPPILRTAQWRALDSIDALVSRVEGVLLLYGAQRPQLRVSSPTSVVEYDRPQRPCDVLVLWTLPPSWTHLCWLLAVANPQQIYVCNRTPHLPSAADLRLCLQLYLDKFPAQPLNLLQLGQKWWIAPCTLVAALRELDYPCADFPTTYSLDQELQRLQRWYRSSVEQLAALNLRQSPIESG